MKHVYATNHERVLQLYPHFLSNLHQILQVCYFQLRECNKLWLLGVWCSWVCLFVYAYLPHPVSAGSKWSNNNVEQKQLRQTSFMLDSRGQRGKDRDRKDGGREGDRGENENQWQSSGSSCQERGRVWVGRVPVTNSLCQTGTVSPSL